MIKKAVIAAAGRGTRFLPVTKAYPKELLPIANKPIIHYLIEELIAAGINRVAVVHRWDNDLVPNYFRKDAGLQKFLKKNGKEDLLAELNAHRRALKELTFIPQPLHFRYGTGSPLLAAKNFIGGDDFVYVYGDDLVLEETSGTFLRSLIAAFEEEEAAAVIGAQKVKWVEVQNYGTIEFKKRRGRLAQVVKVCERSSRELAPSNLVQFGRFVLSSKIVDAVSVLRPKGKTELMFPDAVNLIAKKGKVFCAPIKGGRWLTTGDPLSWHRANVAFMNKPRLTHK